MKKIIKQKNRIEQLLLYFLSREPIKYGNKEYLITEANVCYPPFGKVFAEFDLKEII